MEIELQDSQRRLHFWMSPLGAARDVELRHATGTNIENWSERNAFNNGFAQHVFTGPLLPARPIGTGARWTVRREAKWFSARSYLVMHCELGAIDGGGFAISATSEIDTPEQTYAVNNDPVGYVRVLLDMKGQMTHAIAHDGLFPIWAGRTTVSATRHDVTYRSPATEHRSTQEINQETSASLGEK
jgi:hypothetical protein